jgi:hypothetical protein
MFFLNVPTILLGVDRMNEIDRVTPATLWISLGSGLIAGGSSIWLALSKSKHESLKLKQWVAICAWGPISAILVGWSLNWVATIVPGETRAVQATVESLRTAEGACAHATLLLFEKTIQTLMRFVLPAALADALGRTICPSVSTSR